MIWFILWSWLSWVTDSAFSSVGDQFLSTHKQALNIFDFYDLCYVVPESTFLSFSCSFFLFLVPNFQINMLLNFKDDKSECPCPEEIRDQLLDFHEDLMAHCGKVFSTCSSYCMCMSWRKVSMCVNRFSSSTTPGNPYGKAVNWPWWEVGGQRCGDQHGIWTSVLPLCSLFPLVAGRGQGSGEL